MQYFNIYKLKGCEREANISVAVMRLRKSEEPGEPYYVEYKSDCKVFARVLYCNLCVCFLKITSGTLF
jgi:hypothetical protein